MTDIVITHPEKVMFPDDGITKGELAAYYGMVATILLPHIERRPLTMERFHRGIGDKGFFQKNVPKGAPAWLERVPVPRKSGVGSYPVLTDERGIAWMANQNCITPHVWTSRAPELDRPDIVIFDLDPIEDDAAVLRSVTLLLRDMLDEVGLKSWVKTTGSRGFHVAVPIDGTQPGADVARFTHRLGAELVKRDPRHVTQEFYKADRGGRILIDTARNEIGATYATPYAIRPRRGAPVSAPCSWDEVEQGIVAPGTFTLRDMPERLAQVGDLWSGMWDVPQVVGQHSG